MANEAPIPQPEVVRSSSSEAVSPLRRLDAMIFELEKVIVTISAVAMVTTVSLDILFRALKGLQSRPLIDLFSLFGLIAPLPDIPLERNLLSFCLFLLFSYGFGWGVYRSAHRGEEGASREAHKAGAFSLALLITVCVVVRYVPSWFVCGSLSAVTGVAVAWLQWGRGLKSHAGLSLAGGVLGAWLCRSLPQDYIWSQELSLILLSWLAFVGGSMATYQHKHIEISALSKLIPASLSPWVRPLSLMATGLFSLYVCALLTESAFGATGSYISGEVRPATQIPTWIILLSGVFAFGMIALRSIGYSVAGLLDPSSLAEKEAVH